MIFKVLHTRDWFTTLKKWVNTLIISILTKNHYTFTPLPILYRKKTHFLKNSFLKNQFQPVEPVAFYLKYYLSVFYENLLVAKSVTSVLFFPTIRTES